jgi:hypothetical protein
VAPLLEHNTINLTGRLIEETEDATWDEVRIDRRTSQLIDVLLAVWPVPERHEGRVADPQTKAQAAAGQPSPLTGKIELDGKCFSTPSGAARRLRKKITNGWHFWSVSDGRRLRDVRAVFLSGVERTRQAPDFRDRELRLQRRKETRSSMARSCARR